MKKWEARLRRTLVNADVPKKIQRKDGMILYPHNIIVGEVIHIIAQHQVKLSKEMVKFLGF